MRKSGPIPVTSQNPRLKQAARSGIKTRKKVRRKNPFIRISLIVLTVGLIVNAFTGKPSETNARILYNGSEKSTESQYKEVRASHILVDTKQEALKLRKEILENKDFAKSFAKAAKETSKCPSGAQGGDLGYFETGMMVPEFEKTAFNLPIGEISEPVKTEFGWHLIITTDKR